MRLRGLLLASIVLASTLAISAVEGQSPDAASPDASLKVLYAHHDEEDTEELHGWMNTLEDDGNDVAVGPSGGPTAPFVGVPAGRVHTFTLNPALTGTLVLDPEGMIDVTAHIGSGGGNGATRVSTRILYGDEVVTAGTAQNHPIVQAGSGPYTAVTWSLPPMITELAPGSDLVWEITIEGASTAVFISVSEERGRSNIALPILELRDAAPGGNTTTPALPQVTQNTTATEGTLSVIASNATTWSETFTFDVELTNATVHFAGRAGTGSMQAVLESSEGVLATANVTTSVNETMTLEGLSPGTWTLTIEMDQFAGAFSMAYRQTPQAEAPETQAPETETDDEDTLAAPVSEAPADDHADHDNESPGVGLASLLLAFGALALVRRR